jgi:AbiU2
MFENLTIAERVAEAKEKTRRVVDHLLYVLELHENNAIVLYSPTLSAQIPLSFAANAFKVFQQGLHQFEIVRLCALWDGPDPKKENIPTVIELVDHPDVINSLAQEISTHWNAPESVFYYDDPEAQASAVAAFQQIDELFGEEQAEKARLELRRAIDDGRAIMTSAKHASIMNLRDKHLAHSLSETWREQRTGPIAPMKYGDEHDMLDATVPIVEALYRWLNRSSISFDNSRRIDRKNAEALWTACKFKIER